MKLKKTVSAVLAGAMLLGTSAFAKDNIYAYNKFISTVIGLGFVIGDLSSRRGMVKQQESRSGGVTQVTADVPLAEMFGYATVLRSGTQGRGQYSMEPSHYSEVPKSVQEKIMNERAKN